VDFRVESAEEAAKIAMNSWDAGIESAVLLVVPPPEATAMPGDVIEKVISAALAEAEQKGIHGAATTPFLLQRVSELTGGESLRANIDLLRNNASVAAQVAVAMTGLRKAGPF
jgi:pseudouridine-5'-phosphate glycosidase